MFNFDDKYVIYNKSKYTLNEIYELSEPYENTIKNAVGVALSFDLNKLESFSIFLRIFKHGKIYSPGLCTRSPGVDVYLSRNGENFIDSLQIEQTNMSPEFRYNMKTSGTTSQHNRIVMSTFYRYYGLNKISWNIKQDWVKQDFNVVAHDADTLNLNFSACVITKNSAFHAETRVLFIPNPV